MTRALALLLGLSMLASPVAAQKQTEMETGSLIGIPRRARIADGSGISAVDRGRMAMAEFARCTVDRRSSGVAKMLTLPADAVASNTMAALADDECLASGQLKFKPILLRGALFVELYRRRIDGDRRNVVWRMPVVAFDPAKKVEDASGNAAVQVALLTLAQCVVERDAAGAKAVVLSPTSSKAQDAAFVALTPKIGSCLYAGQKLALSKMVLEGALGEVLYRGAVPTARPASQETK